MNDRPLQMARALAERDGPFLFFDSGKGEGESSIFSDPVAVVRDLAPVDLRAWMSQHLAAGRWVAGMLGFEYAWELDSVRAERRTSRFPPIWVGAFESRWSAASTAFPALSAPVRGAPKNRVELDVSRESYEESVRLAVDAIYSGELFEVNYTERFRTRWEGSGFELFERLREQATGSYFGYLQADDFVVASVSPEEFLRVDGRHVTTRPIKGTRRRGASAEEDADARAELRTSEKDRAENVMIVDLMRNDLTRFSLPGTVRATTICAVESFAGWHHLVSTVEGTLEEDVLPTDVLLGSFPPGSITGAPKLRSIELIAELEASARGPYTGTMFWADRSTLRSNVLIRTAALRDGEAEYGAGGAIVADSDPAAEYEEALVKAAPFLALGAEDGS